MSSKFDYDDEAFYKQLEKLASTGMTDTEIASVLGFSHSYFCSLKNGRVASMPEDKRKERSERFKAALAKGRVNITAALHATYLNIALGKIVTKTKVRKKQETPCFCGGKDRQCPDCGGTGIVLTDIGVIQENEIQQPPSLQALATLLNVFDPDWRAGVTEAAAASGKGIDISRWIEQEMADKSAREDGGETKADPTTEEHDTDA